MEHGANVRPVLRRPAVGVERRDRRREAGAASARRVRGMFAATRPGAGDGVTRRSAPPSPRASGTALARVSHPWHHRLAVPMAGEVGVHEANERAAAVVAAALHAQGLGGGARGATGGVAGPVASSPHAIRVPAAKPATRAAVAALDRTGAFMSPHPDDSPRERPSSGKKRWAGRTGDWYTGSEISITYSHAAPRSCTGDGGQRSGRPPSGGGPVPRLVHAAGARLSVPFHPGLGTLLLPRRTLGVRDP